ncbi:unnamed protein product [Prunus armeniaca]
MPLQLSHFLSLQKILLQPARILSLRYICILLQVARMLVKPRGQYDQKRTSEDGKTNKTDTSSISSGELKDFPAPSVRTSERDPVANLIQGKLQGIPKSSGESNCCIYRVPKSFRKGNKQSYYKPWAVPIGPYHLGAGGGLEVMQAFKFNYVKAFLDRYNKMNLDLCVQTVRTWEAKARSSYAQPFELSSNDFVLVLLVDATFVLELMIRNFFPSYIDMRDPIYGKPRMIEDVSHDMILIENQLPLFVLEGLFTQIGGTLDVSFPDLTHEFFKQLVKIEKFPGHVVCHEVKHFVDFVRHFYYLPSLPLDEEQREDNNNVVCECPSVTTLDEAGIKFVTKTCTSSSFLDIQFTDGVLRIPGFAIDDWTTTLFLNLIAFEQCHEHAVKYISHYIIFLMRCMIRTSKDVDLLVQNKIISSRPGSSRDLLTLLDHIGKDVGLGETNCYFSLCKNLNAYVTQKNEETRNQCIPSAEEVDNNSQEQLFPNSVEDYVYYCNILIMLTFIYKVYYHAHLHRIIT